MVRQDSIQESCLEAEGYQDPLDNAEAEHWQTDGGTLERNGRWEGLKVVFSLQVFSNSRCTSESPRETFRKTDF